MRWRSVISRTRSSHASLKGDAGEVALDAQRQFDRAKQLRADKLIAQADYDTAEANLAAAKAQVAAAEGAVAQSKASLHQAQINLAYTTIESPINGVVISRSCLVR